MNETSSNEIILEIAPGECWYGFNVADGCRFPLNAGSEYQGNIDPNQTVNQAAALLLSSHGRRLWCDDGISLTAANGRLTVRSAKSPLRLSDTDSDLRTAYRMAAQTFFPPSGQCPPDLFFRVPQYNTWIELIYEQNQAAVLSYARALLDNEYPPGILMIDDGWMIDYGRWEFHPGRFPDPPGMIDELHQMGFIVMLWTCPFVSADGAAFLALKEKGLLLKNAAGAIAVREWWNGFSAVLDFTNPAAIEWYQQQNQRLMERYGVDGFKFDAGDGQFYQDDDRTYLPADANSQTVRWAEIGLKYPYNEFRAGFRGGGQALVQRLADKHHSWDENGVAALVPNHLAQGLLGYPFSCPDMIGGGEYANFTAHSRHLDEELFVRYAQCAALMPMMQFSAAPWRVLSPEAAAICLDAVRLHEFFAPRIMALARHAAVSGEPITRYMEYQFPGQGLAMINDQFMLGEDVLVAPVLQKGRTARTVRLPRLPGGGWRGNDGKIYPGGGTVEVPAPLAVLPYFIRQDA